MAAVVVPPALEGAAAILGTLLGYGGAKALDEAARKKQQEDIDKAKSTPVAKAGTQAQTKTCSKCPPDCGQLVTRNWNMSEESRDYQMRITGFAPQTEWNFKGIDFDGFQSADCNLQEAKGRYDQFFDKQSGEPKAFFVLFGIRRMLVQAEAQSLVSTSSVPATLTWYFMQPRSYLYFSKLFAVNFPIITLLAP